MNKKMSVRYLTLNNGTLEKIIIEKNKNVKKQVYKLLRRDDYSLTLRNLYCLFGVENEDKREGKALYLKRLFLQYIREEM